MRSSDPSFLKERKIFALMEELSGCISLTKKFSFLMRMRERIDGHPKATCGQRCAWCLGRSSTFLHTHFCLKILKQLEQRVSEKSILAAIQACGKNKHVKHFISSYRILFPMGDTQQSQDQEGPACFPDVGFNGFLG